jgi:pimeloyl-ACP methyl ester carboxylesterase
MPAVLVHGVPDTERAWRGVVSRLERTDVVTVSLPGFGCPEPAGFAATKDAYAAWLVEQLAAYGPYAPTTWGERLARRAGAPLVVFSGCAHWWPLGRPADVASLVTSLWGER